jgi:hypothetical protein
MSELSRPYQIALASVVGLALIWLFALRAHGPSPSSSSPSSSSGAQSAAQHPGASSPVYHGAAPGVEGLTKDVNKAHGAVATSEHNAQELQSQSASASDEAVGTHKQTSTSPATVRQPAQPATHVSHAAASAHKPAQKAPSRSGAGSASSPVKLVEQDLAHGKMVLLLFWNPRSLSDVEVYRQLGIAHHDLAGKVVVRHATAGQVGAFGAITQHVQVNQTPTLLIINKHGVVSTLTGLADAFSIDQAVSEAAHSL